MTLRGGRPDARVPSRGAAVALAACLCLAAPPASAFETLEFRAAGLPDDLSDDLRSVSLLAGSQREGRPIDADQTLAAAQSDYGRMIGILYDAGYFAPVIRIRLDGREAARISPLERPDRIDRVEIVVEPGPVFTFGDLRAAPLAPGTVLPEGFRSGAPASSGVLRDAATAAVEGWRGVGHPRAAIAGQDIVADHRASQLDARLSVAPGPQLDFGTLRVSGAERTRTDRIRAIAGLPGGERFDPEAIARAAERLRRTGTFNSVTLTEAATDNPDGSIDIEAVLVEAPLRRIGFGAELDTMEGVRLSAYWIHRNLLGGAERLRIDGEIGGIGARVPEFDDLEFRFAARFTRPATFTPDTDLSLSFSAETVAEMGYDARRFRLGGGVEHRFSRTVTAEAALQFNFERVTDALGTRNFSSVSLPLTATWDNRNDPLNATSGVYVSAGLVPFLGFEGTGSGAQLLMDSRAYYGIGTEDRVVIAARAQAGGVVGADICDTPRDLLFYSGGGGTVRGQPFRSLGASADCGGTEVVSGGQGFAAVSAELRARITDTIGVVAFADAGHVSEGFFTGPSDWHAGAGLGLRYLTGIGPIRVDVAAPLHGSTSDGVQLYIGIGQTF